jgi:hypothetical protein
MADGLSVAISHAWLVTAPAYETSIALQTRAMIGASEC